MKRSAIMRKTVYTLALALALAPNNTFQHYFILFSVNASIKYIH